MNHLGKPLHARLTGAHVAETTNYRRLSPSAHEHRVSQFQKAAVVFLAGIIAGLWLASWINTALHEAYMGGAGQ
jgi:hypothetical protein